MKLSSLKNIFRRDRHHHYTLGLEIRPDGIAWALRTAAAGYQAGFDACTPAQREKVLKNRLNELAAGHCRVRAVLPLDQYQVFQIDRPPVEDAELANALRWKVKDLIDFSLDDAVIDVFEFPDNATRGGGALVNAVVARRSLVQELSELVAAVGLELAEVDVAELAMRNLLSGLVAESRCTALVYLRPQFGHMVVCQGHTLYMSRRLDVRAEQLRDAATQEQAVTNLGLEVQRSLDYYESQLRQVPPRQIYVIGQNPDLPLGGLLADSLAAEVLPLPLAEELGLPSLDPRSVYALGTAKPVVEAQ